MRISKSAKGLKELLEMLRSIAFFNPATKAPKLDDFIVSQSGNAQKLLNVGS